MGIITDGCLLVLKALPVIALLAILLGEVVLRRHRARHPGRPAATLCGGHEYENRFVKLRDGRQLCFCLHGNQDPSAGARIVARPPPRR
ncbi:hypothetical protein H696_01852 [Fonticula alba]|uniref:Uncharacterized protein n=1 Tax=Fonticula alba TaxID=691883 RepID=A0A058Z9W4_FONAL|nr:hypothetical protein H696_01852 [Fonticula alba]KCV70906.1 hypothetical protein H696_01852 [Fonticula alba]|eukprot:XP_009494029.1 hypothetical protein H696_01852 [Fonticula alba]